MDISSCICAVAVCLLLSACSATRFMDEREIGAMSAAAPDVVYVKDFALEPHRFQPESGILPLPPISSGASGMLIPRLLGIPEDPASRERELVKSMSAALLDDLAHAGFNARYLPSGELFPRKGWLVRGVFVQMEEGNRLRRALIGFGSGATRLRVNVWVSDLAQGTPGPFCALDISTRSNRKPGAAFTFDPYEGAARFVLDGLDLDNNVTELASEIADDIVERLRTGRPPEHWEAKLKRLL